MFYVFPIISLYCNLYSFAEFVQFRNLSNACAWKIGNRWHWRWLFEYLSALVIKWRRLVLIFLPKRNCGCFIHIIDEYHVFLYSLLYENWSHEDLLFDPISGLYPYFQKYFSGVALFAVIISCDYRNNDTQKVKSATPVLNPYAACSEVARASPKLNNHCIWPNHLVARIAKRI